MAEEKRTLRALRRTGRMNTSEELPVTAKTAQRASASRHQAPEKRGAGISLPGRVVQAQNFCHGPRACAPPPPPPPPGPEQKPRRTAAADDASLLVHTGFSHTLPPLPARAAQAQARAAACNIAERVGVVMGRTTRKHSSCS